MLVTSEKMAESLFKNIRKGEYKQENDSATGGDDIEL